MSSLKGRRTEVSSDYPSCKECYATLVIYPRLLHPEVISEMLGITPTRQNVLGEKITNSQGRTREIEKSGWFLSTENIVFSKDLRDHLDWLLNKIEPSCNVIEKLQCGNEAIMAISCVWHSLVGHGGPVLWPEQMKRMSDLNMEFGLDLLYFED